MVSNTSFRDAMSRLGAAVNVVTTDGTGGRAGFTATAVCSVSDEPPTVLVCVHCNSQAGITLRENGLLCINVLRAGDNAVADTFAGRSGVYGNDRFGSGEWYQLSTGAPVLKSALIALDCRIFETQKVGSHCVCLARVEAIHEGHQGPALMYFQRRYSALEAAI
ncbi:flavin reductase [Pusillimonas noertemannii]|uniref:Flavin reductase n=1 Tax=Pusillimonas noertemannii TaxID=305977 RepID=A0A2U1CL19_9BURK|nr:flavin reductase [Pusillimonas noertemannii]NYT69222.1 flavin reductase [Pusillimonas noertemannii]PVY61691.1 flavin reductase [Pusillimonas noertemannii]TFL09631.1 flavin reductase [Pusillimonas noertemannii]